MGTQKRTSLSRILLAGCCSVVFSLTGSLAWAGTIVGTDHDFSTSTWSGGEICIACHTPHNADTTTTDAPLWNHALTAATYTLYSSPSLDATVGQPDGSSKLCLSCHDGTVALDSFGGVIGSTYISGTANIGEGTPGGTTGDLSNDHPISITYDAALAGTDTSLFDPTVGSVTIGQGGDSKTGTIDDVMLLANKVQCASCHDVHNKYAIPGTPLLRITDAASALCLTCHNK